MGPVEELARPYTPVPESEVDSPSSGVHGVTGNVVGTTDTQTLENKTIDGTAATGNNTITTDASDITYDNATSGLTATTSQDAIDELESSKANTSLSNLTSPTAINQDLILESDKSLILPNDIFLKSRNAADSTNINILKLNSSDRIVLGNGTNITINGANVIPDSTGQNLGASGAAWDITINQILSRLEWPNNNATLSTQNSTSTNPIKLQSGNASEGTSGDVIINSGAATGDSGSVSISTGSSSGGTRGTISLSALEIDASNSQIKNVVDPTDAQDAATKNYVDTSALQASSGDINETSFSITNNQTTPADVTGLAFANGTVRSAEVEYSIFIDADTDSYESGVLRLVQKISSWDLSQATNGDNSQINFSVTSAGQVQYTSADYTGFVSGTIKFRATTTST